MPSKLSAADGLARFLEPLGDLIDLRDGLLAAGTLEQAADEAQTKLDLVNRDIDTARAQLDAITMANSAATDNSAVIIAEAKAAAKAIKTAADAAAKDVADKAAAAAAAASDDAAARLADVEAQIAAQQAVLAKLGDDAETAEARVAAAHSELSAILAKLGA